MALLEVENLSHAFAEKILYKDSSFELYKGEHMGIVGQNGTGKSTLIKLLLKESLPDKGTIKWQNGITIGHLDQYAIVKQEETIFDYLKTAFAGLYDIENKLNELYMEMAEKYTEEIAKKVTKYQEVLEKENFYEIDSKVKKVTSRTWACSFGIRYST